MVGDKKWIKNPNPTKPKIFWKNTLRNEVKQSQSTKNCEQ